MNNQTAQNYTPIPTGQALMPAIGVGDLDRNAPDYVAQLESLYAAHLLRREAFDEKIMHFKEAWSGIDDLAGLLEERGLEVVLSHDTYGNMDQTAIHVVSDRPYSILINTPTAEHASKAVDALCIFGGKTRMEEGYIKDEARKIRIEGDLIHQKVRELAVATPLSEISLSNSRYHFIGVFGDKVYEHRQDINDPIPVEMIESTMFTADQLRDPAFIENIKQSLQGQAINAYLLTNPFTGYDGEQLMRVGVRKIGIERMYSAMRDMRARMDQEEADLRAGMSQFRRDMGMDAPKTRLGRLGALMKRQKNRLTDRLAKATGW